MHKLTDLLKRFRRDESGAFLVLFAVLAIVLIATSGAVVDFTYMQTARSRAQTALDAAALGLQAKMSTTTEADLQAQAQRLIRERLADNDITATVTSAAKDAANGKLNLIATITVPTTFVQLVGIRSITANVSSEVTRGSVDLEVSVALDITGSMGTPSSKIADLKTATNDLIDIVVQTAQTPSYSRMALVPYAPAVNVGALADNVRGPVTTKTKNITAASFYTGTKFTVTGITKANSGVVTTSAAHGLKVGDTVFISGVGGMTQVNNLPYSVTAVGSTTTFTINVKTTNYSNFSSNGSVVKCTYANCDVAVTAAAHGWVSGDGVYVTGVNGMTGLNNTGYFVTALDANTLLLLNSAAGGGSAYTSGGTLSCANYGCAWYHFNTAGNTENTLPVTTCVSERTVNTYTDAAPSTTRLGFQYASPTANPCIAQNILPLTDNKTRLHALANSLAAGGSTAGHLGLAWAWYMIAPNFNYLWPPSPTAWPAAPYKKTNLIKAVILMTDGFFNTAYCNGVITGSVAQSGAPADHTACNPVAVSQTQAMALCNAIKDPSRGIILYTIGFDIGTNSADDKAARQFLNDCATDSAHFYQANTGTDLKAAFRTIGESLSELRLSK